MFADGDQTTIVDDQPSVTGRIGGREACDCNRCTVRDRCAQFAQGLRPDQRGIGEHHENIVEAAFERGACCEHRMRGAKPLHLPGNLDFRKHAPGFRRHRVMIRSNHGHAAGGAGLGHRTQHMRQQRLIADRMQHLRQGRSHAGALARRQHHRQACSYRHPDPRFRPAS
jgi:hypothetical protein